MTSKNSGDTVQITNALFRMCRCSEYLRIACISPYLYQNVPSSVYFFKIICRHSLYLSIFHVCIFNVALNAESACRLSVTSDLTSHV